MTESMNDNSGADAPIRQTELRRDAPPVTLWAMAAVLTVIVVAAIVVAAVIDRPTQNAPGTISVTGSGTVQGVPDTVSFQIGVQSVAASAANALAANNVRVRDLENSLFAHGVAHRDMQTSGLDIYTNTNNQGAVTGFTVDNNVNVSMHDIAAAGVALDAAVRVAGNGIQLSGISFSISDQSKYLAQARVKAMQDARTAATQVAKGGGASLGAIEKITDQENVSSVTIPFPEFKASLGTASSVPLQAGSQPINVQVAVVYALKG